MKEPCGNCPFRSNPAFHGLGEQRAKSIVDGLFEDDAFHCHKTVDYNQGDGQGVVTPDSKLCIGAAIFLEKCRTDGGLKANRAFRVGVMIGELHPDELSKTAPVYGSVQEFIDGCY